MICCACENFFPRLPPDASDLGSSVQAVVICVEAMRKEFNELESLKIISQLFASVSVLHQSNIEGCVWEKCSAISKLICLTCREWHGTFDCKGYNVAIIPLLVIRNVFMTFSVSFVLFISQQASKAQKPVHTTDYWETPTHDNMCTRKGFFY